MSRPENAVEASKTDWSKIRSSFPILKQQVNGRPLVYLDNAATTQVPTCVINAIQHHYREQNANVHRATHELSSRSTNAFEHARSRIAEYIKAPSSNSIIFTRGTTDSLNIIASSLAEKWRGHFSALASAMEHHSNYVPWQQAAKRTGGTFSVIPLDPRGDIDLEAYERMLKENPAGIVSLTHVSNVLGTVNPIKDIIALAHQQGWLTSIDAAQSIRHECIDVGELDCDFLSFSGHKTLAPTGIGVLYGKEDLLNSLPPIAFGGEMVDTVRFAETTFEVAPLRFEAGTPNYVGAIALASAFDFLDSIGRESISQCEHSLLKKTEDLLSRTEGVRIVGSPCNRAGVVSFTVDGVHSFDIATLMDKMGIAIRSGSQCAQPLLNETYSLGNTTRISPAFYNTPEEIDAAIAALRRAIAMCRR